MPYLALNERDTHLGTAKAAAYVVTGAFDAKACGEFVVPGRNTPTLLDPFEEALNQVAHPVSVWAKSR